MDPTDEVCCHGHSSHCTRCTTPPHPILMVCHFLLQSPISHCGRSPQNQRWSLKTDTAYTLHLTQEATGNRPKTHWGRWTLFPRSKYSSACTLEQLVNLATCTICRQRLCGAWTWSWQNHRASSPSAFWDIYSVLTVQVGFLFQDTLYACLLDTEMSGAIFSTKQWLQDLTATFKIPVISMWVGQYRFSSICVFLIAKARFTMPMVLFSFLTDTVSLTIWPGKFALKTVISWVKEKYKWENVLTRKQQNMKHINSVMWVCFLFFFLLTTLRSKRDTWKPQWFYLQKELDF